MVLIIGGNSELGPGLKGVKNVLEERNLRDPMLWVIMYICKSLYLLHEKKLLLSNRCARKENLLLFDLFN